MKNTSLLSQPKNTKGIAKRAADISVSAIKEISLLASTMNDVVSLGWGLPSFQTPHHIREAAIDSLRNEASVGKYSLFVGMKELRERIAKRVYKETGLKINPNSEIVITVGSIEALHDVLLTLVERGDEIIIPSPCFSSHIEQIALCEGKPIFVPLVEKNNWRLDIDIFKKNITKKTKAILLTSPVNPTGSVLVEEELCEVAKLALEHNIYIITDETYNFLLYDGVKQFRLAQIHKLKNLLITCCTFSKEYAMTGFRVGYMFGPEEVIFQALKVHDANTISAPTISQYAAIAALKGSQSQVQEFVKKFAARRDLICNRLDKLSSSFSYVKPTGAYYVFPKFKLVSIKTSNELVLKLLYEAKVATVPGSAFGPGGEGHIRLSYGGNTSEINEAFDRIEEWLKNNK